MKNIHAGHRSRLRERVKNEGLDNFQAYQVLEYALSFVVPYKDTNPIAHRLIEEFGSIAGVLEADEEDIKKIDGMGEVSAHFLTSIIKIYSYYEREKSNNVEFISRPDDSYRYVKNLFKGKLNEELYLVSLLPNNKIFKCEKVSQGTQSQANVTIRQITDMISRNRVSNVVLAHNHPNGRAEPSIEDNKLTQALVTSLAINGCFLVDHIIVGERDYYSYRQSGVIDKYRDGVKEFLLTSIAQKEAKYEVDYDQE